MEVWEKAGGVELPYGAGRLGVKIVPRYPGNGRGRVPLVVVIELSVSSRTARALTDGEIIELLRLAYFRLWSRADMAIFDEPAEGSCGDG